MVFVESLLCLKHLNTFKLCKTLFKKKDYCQPPQDNMRVVIIEPSSLTNSI